MSVIRETWAAHKPQLFSAEQKMNAVSGEELQRIGAQLDHNITRLGAFGAQMETGEDFGLLEKPLQDFQKYFVVFLGTLSAMGGGSRAGKSLRHEISDFGNQVADAFAAVEELIAKKDVALVKGGLARCIGNLLETLKKWTKVPRQNHTAVKKRLIKKIRELRDAATELNEELADAEELDVQAENAKTFTGVLSAIEDVLKNAIHGIKDDQVVEVAEMEKFLLTVGAITGLTDNICSNLQSLDDEMWDDELDVIDEEEEEDDGEGKDEERIRETAENLEMVDKLNALLCGEFKAFANAVNASGREESFAKLEGELMPRLKSGLAGA